MARSRNRRGSKITWIIRGCAILAIAAIVAWQYDYLPHVDLAQIKQWLPHAVPVGTGTVADESSDEFLDTDAEVNPIVMNESDQPAVEQPTFDEQANQAVAHIAESSPPAASDEWYELTTPSMPASPPQRFDQRPHGAASPAPNKQSDVQNAAFATEASKPAQADQTNHEQPDPASDNPFAAASQQNQPSQHESSAQLADEAPQSFPTPAQTEPAAPEDSRLVAIDGQIAAGKYLEAHQALSTIYWNEPEMRAAIGDRIATTSESIYFAPQPHYMDPYIIEPGDQLRVIASRYKVSWEYLARLNQIDPRRIRPEQRLKVIKGPFSAIVDLSDFELTIHSHGYFVRRYQVGIGKDNSTPAGTFAAINKVTNPQYTDPEGRVVSADDPTNPLGERWIDLGHSYGIHGTIEPDSIGKAESRGCIRLRNGEIDEVYDLLTIGSQVVIQR